MRLIDADALICGTSNVMPCNDLNIDCGFCQFYDKEEHFCLLEEWIYNAPTIEAHPTIIRAKTFMREADFDKWAEDIKRQGKNIICIPCDAEVVSADAVHESCEDCPLYDKERHNCPRFNKVIPRTIAESVQGEWTHDGSMWENRWVCNKCGHKIFERQTNFCPNCGARMYKGGDDE